MKIGKRRLKYNRAKKFLGKFIGFACCTKQRAPGDDWLQSNDRTARGIGPATVRLPPPLLCIKFAVQPLTAHNGPTRIDSCTMRLVISGKHTSVTITTTSFVAHVAHLGEPDLTLDDAKRS